MVKKYDTINGVKVHFGPKTDYEAFIDVITIVSEENVSTWILLENNIYVIQSAKQKPQKRRIFFCGTAEVSFKNSRLMEEENQKKELQIFQTSFFKQQWLIFLSYLGIVLINIFALVKFNKNKYYNQK